MDGQESDQRILIAEMRLNQEHQQKSLSDLTSAIKESNANQAALTTEVHSMVKTYIADRGRLDALERNDIDKEQRLRINETFITALRPDVERKRLWIDRIVPTLIIAAVLAIAGIFYVNPFK